VYCGSAIEGCYREVGPIDKCLNFYDGEFDNDIGNGPLDWGKIYTPQNIKSWLRSWSPIFKKKFKESYDNLRIFVQYTLILRQIYDITTLVRTLLTL